MCTYWTPRKLDLLEYNVKHLPSSQMDTETDKTDNDHCVKSQNGQYFGIGYIDLNLPSIYIFQYLLWSFYTLFLNNYFSQMFLWYLNSLSILQMFMYKTQHPTVKGNDNCFKSRVNWINVDFLPELVARWLILKSV